MNFSDTMDAIQTALIQCRGTDQNFYRESPGQIVSHVDYRVAARLAIELNLAGYKLVKEDV